MSIRKPNKSPPAASPQPAAPQNDRSARTDPFVREIAGRASGLGREVADIAGVIEDTVTLGDSQAKVFEQLRDEVARMVEANGRIDEVARGTERISGTALGALDRVAQGVDAVNGVLHQVFDAAQGISKIAFQTRIVAFNATVEAKRAGQAGAGFGVVADAVKALAEQVEASTKQIMSTVQDLSQKVEALSGDVRRRDGGRGAESIEGAFGALRESIHAVAEAAVGNTRICNGLAASVEDLSRELHDAHHALKGAQGKTDGLLRLSENLIELTSESGFETEDSPYIARVTQTAAHIARLFEAALARGEIAEDDLFDERYVPIAGSNPQQHLTRFVALTDRLLPPVQEPLLEFSKKVVFCAAVDRNGYLPTHNLKFSRPQGKDPVWNVAHCRNRRIFNDRTGLAAGRNRKPFLLQTYRRDMGGGRFALMKDLSAPIWVRGRHWGGFRMGYLFE
jgi:methyl-accepting chemotaxis protein